MASWQAYRRTTTNSFTTKITKDTKKTKIRNEDHVYRDAKETLNLGNY